ncbi:MAG: zf-HC2 domain-containing protein [Planctomycetota bacterium]
MKACRVARGRIERAVDGRLAVEERFLLEEHLAACPRCAAEHARAAALAEALQRWPEPAGEEIDGERAVGAIRAAIAAREHAALRAARGRRRLALAGAAAGVAASAGIATILLRAGEPEVAAPAAPLEPAVAASPAPPPAVAVESDPDAPDPARLAAARNAVRASLAAAFAGFRDEADPRPPAARFDAATRELRRAHWPIPRLVEDLLADPDPALAAGAARYLGVRGDRASVLRLAAALPGAPAKAPLVRALGDRGPLAIGALGALLGDPAAGELAAAELARIGGPEAAAALEAEVRRQDSGSPRRAALLAHLAATGAASVESFLRLAAEDEEGAGALLDHLARAEGAAEELGRIAGSAGRRHPSSVLFAAVGRLQPSGALGWVEERTRESASRAAALECLAGWEGPEALEALLRIDARGAVPDAEIYATLDTLVERAPDRLAAFVEMQLARGDAAGAERLLHLLLVLENPWTGESLARIALADLLPAEDRQWAALAVGEVGRAADAERLAAGLPAIDRDERRLLAAGLISIHAHLGPAGAARALEGLEVPSPSRVLAALADASRRDARAGGLHRVARALDVAAGPRDTFSTRFVQ